MKFEDVLTQELQKDRRGLKKEWDNLKIKKTFRHLTDPEYRKYLKMRRRHKRELTKLARKSEDFDWYFLHELIVIKIKHFLEYYESGWNVWQTEETRTSLIESLKRAIEIDEQFGNAWKTEDPDEPWWDKETRLLKEFYTYIGDNIQRWWD